MKIVFTSLDTQLEVETLNELVPTFEGRSMSTRYLSLVDILDTVFSFFPSTSSRIFLLFPRHDRAIISAAVFLNEEGLSVLSVPDIGQVRVGGKKREKELLKIETNNKRTFGSIRFALPVRFEAETRPFRIVLIHRRGGCMKLKRYGV